MFTILCVRKRTVVFAMALTLATSGAYAEPQQPNDAIPSGTVTAATRETTVNQVAEQPPFFSVSIRARVPNVQLETRSSDGETVARCRDRCELRVPAGAYTARQDYGDGLVLREAEFVVERSGTFEIEDAKRSNRTSEISGSIEARLHKSAINYLTIFLVRLRIPENDEAKGILVVVR